MNERAMPKPNCTEEMGIGSLDFGLLGRCVVERWFDGESMTSDGGVLLLAQVDSTLVLMGAAARCIADPRHPVPIQRDVRGLLRRRVYGLVLGCVLIEQLSELATAQIDTRRIRLYLASNWPGA